MRTYLLGTTLLVCFIVVIGCGKDSKATALSTTSKIEEKEAKKEKDLTIGKVHREMANNLRTYAETEKQTHNRMARTMILNERGMNDDLMRFFLLDRPSRSTIYPNQ